MTLMTIVLMAAGTMLALAIFISYALGWANKAFHVAVDPRVEAVAAALPGANCGGCECVGCREYAVAVVEGKLPPDKCTVGGVSCATALAKILGVELKPTWPYRPAVHCGATTVERLGRHEYRGERTCISANLVAGVQGCTYGCLGLGDCEAACAFDAIHMVQGLASADYAKCTGCGACARVCPRNIISMVPFKTDRMLVVACSNKDFGKDVRAVCKVGCIGCRACGRASSLFKVEDNLSVIDYDQYDPDKMDVLKLAIKKCPMKRLILVGKPTEEDLKGVADKKRPEVVQADFKTTVDQTEWHG